MRKILKHQAYHLLSFLTIGVLLYFASINLSTDLNRLWGLSAMQWVLLSWLLAGVHQAWILIFWRLELFFGKISASMGKTGFPIYRIGFIILALVRLLPIIPVSISTANTMAFPLYMTITLIATTAPFILWAVYSVIFYFGVNRAFGADHFDPAYREESLEKRGIFKYIPNSMYTIVFLLLYHPGLFWQSPLGLIIAGAHHAFVWVHYFCTEKPDMKEIYG